MMTSLARVGIRYEQDVVHVRQQARLIAEQLGFDRQDQTRISTAVSEIARNAHQYGQGGEVEFMLEATAHPPRFTIAVRDHGPGIAELDTILEGRYTSRTGMGMGIVGSRRLLEYFHIDTSPGRGTTVTLGKSLPLNAPAGTPVMLRRIADALAANHSASPMEEIRAQNQELVVELTARKLLETEIRDAREYAENIVETVRQPLLVLNSDLKILTANHSFYDTFKVTPENTIGNFIYDLGNRQWNIPRLRILLDEILPLQTVIDSYEVEHDFPDIGRKSVLLNARQIIRNKIDSHIILLAMEDITGRKQIEAVLHENRKQLQTFNDHLETRIAEEVGKSREKDSLLQHQDKMSSLGRLAAGVAHEINNPMGYIISNLASLSKYVDCHHR
ncbi:MAG: ATP-binding protein [Desulfuromonadaceae bacterium]